MSSSTDPSKSEEDEWTTVTRKARPASSHDSSKTERLINACDHQLFRATTQFVVKNCPRDIRYEILDTLKGGTASVFPRETHHRLIPTLDAISSLLVSKRTREIVAVALVPSYDRRRVTIYLTASGSPDRLESAKAHLQDIWRIIKEMRNRSNRDLYRERTPELAGVDIELATELVLSCYNFSREHLKKHVDKARSTKMHIALEALINQAPQLLTPTQMEFVRQLIAFFNFYEAYENDETASFGSVLRAANLANAARMSMKSEVGFLDICRESILTVTIKKLNDASHPSKYRYAGQSQVVIRGGSND